MIVCVDLVLIIKTMVLNATVKIVGMVLSGKDVKGKLRS